MGGGGCGRVGGGGVGFLKRKKFSWGRLIFIFYFLIMGWKVQASISGNFRKAFLWEYVYFFNIRATKFHFRKDKEFFWDWFVNFWGTENISLFQNNWYTFSYLFIKVNKSVNIASHTYRFCWQYAITLVWKTWSSALN